MHGLRIGLERLLQFLVVALVASLAVIVIVAVIFRKAGASLVWYDEVASILLAWLTYYGAALAALKRAHIGFPGLVRALSPRLQLTAFIVSELCVFSFLLLLAWAGGQVFLILEGDTLVSLPSVSTQITQSVIPIGALLFILAEFLSVPQEWRNMSGIRGKNGEESAGETLSTS